MTNSRMTNSLYFPIDVVPGKAAQKAIQRVCLECSTNIGVHIKTPILRTVLQEVCRPVWQRLRETT